MKQRVLLSFLLIAGATAGLAAFLAFKSPAKNPPPAQRDASGNRFLLSADGKEAVVEESGLRITAPEGWTFSAGATPASVFLRPDASLAECEMRFTHEKNTSSTSASGYLQLNDLGPRFGATITDAEQKIIEISGWQAAYFAWKGAGDIRQRELILPYGAHLLTAIYVENVSQRALSLQPKPCIWDFDWLLSQGITIP